MPTYQYACTECGHSFEEHQSFTDDALSECPTCGGRLRKVFNSVGIVFKGSGFYRNDSREGAKKDNAAPVPAKDSSPAKDSNSGKDKKSDSRPAASTSSASGSSPSSSSSSTRSSSTSGSAA